MAVLIYILILPFNLVWKLHQFLESKLGQNSWRVYPVYLAIFAFFISNIFYTHISSWNLLFIIPVCVLFYRALSREWF